MIETINFFKEKYQTTCPFQLCKEMNIPVIMKSLNGINGMAIKSFNNYLIVLNDSLSSSESNFTLAHELGHIVLEHDLNALFLSNYTLQVTNKYENAANSFATLLLLENYIEFPDFEVLTLDDISRITGIPINIIIANQTYIGEVLESKIT